MGFLADTNVIFRAQLRYRMVSLVVLIAVQSTGLIVMQLAGAEAEPYVFVSAVLSAVLGAAACLFAWGIDVTERRVRLMAMLPTSRVAIATARLLAVASLQLLMSLAAFLISVPFLWARGIIGEAGVVIGSGALWVIALVYSSYFFEEMNIALSRSKVLLWSANFVVMAAMFALMFLGDGNLFELALSPRYLSLAAGMIVAFGGLCVLLFHWRQTFDVGVSPWHGFPVDWSEEAD